MLSETLLYHQEQNRLELNGVVLRSREQIEVRIMGHWIAGQLNKDVTGWYLTTTDKAEIRLQSGLSARIPPVSLSLGLFATELCSWRESQERAKPKLILLVEDDKSHGSMLYQLIRQETSYWVHATSDSQTAWEFLHHVKPNLLLLDYLLPQMNGLMLYDRLRTEEELRDLPVIMISAALPRDEIQKRGIIGFQKPFEIDPLLQTVEVLIT